MPLTQERLKEVLNYDPETGAFTWKIRTSNRVSVGDVAGSLNTSGRMQIRIDGVSYLAHRIAWLYVTGYWPVFHIDHIDGNPLNNTFKNLRDVTRQGNNQNQRSAQSSNILGLLGVSLYKKSGTFKAQITTNRIKKHLGYFHTAEEAHQAYLKAKRELHSTCTI